MTRVIKVGGRAQGDPLLAPTLAAVWNVTPGELCVVHGGGDEISSLQRALGCQPTFVAGRRVTTERDIDMVRMVLSGVANKRLVAQLIAAGAPALGLSGEDAALIVARPLDPQTLGRVGQPERVNVALLWHLLDGGYLPVVAPLARDETSAEGGALNVNGDDAAAAIAAALRAAELFLIADVPGVLVDGEPASVLDVDDALAAISDGIASGGMTAKLQAGIAALRHGVRKVRIGDLNAVLDPTCGTTLATSRSLV
jgi:acetylglutamate kinase